MPTAARESAAGERVTKSNSTAVPAAAKSAAAREAAKMAAAHTAVESAAAMEATTAATMSKCHCVGRHRQTKRDSRRDRNHFATHRSLSFHAPGPPSDAPGLTPVRKKSLWLRYRVNELQIANETNARSRGATIAAARLATVNQIAQWFGSPKRRVQANRGASHAALRQNRTRLSSNSRDGILSLGNFGSRLFERADGDFSYLNFEFNSRRVNGSCAMNWEGDRSNQ
jgi:hypothetical protein